MQGIVETEIAKGRRELGWEVGYVAVNGGNTPSPVVGIVLNNDADFVVKRFWPIMFGAAGFDPVMPDAVTMQIRDGASGQEFYRQPGSPYAMGSMPRTSAPQVVSPGISGRWSSNKMGMPAPMVLRRGSTIFIEFQNPAAANWSGDIYVAAEGFRVYPGASDPIPAKIKGLAFTYVWNGTLALGALAAGVQKLGTITMQGPGQGKYILKTAYIRSTGQVAQTTDKYLLTPADVLAVQIRDTALAGKLWARMGQPQPAVGQILPAAALTCGDTGAPWPQGRYVTGADQIAVDLFGDPACWVGSNPGTIEVGFVGNLIP